VVVTSHIKVVVVLGISLLATVALSSVKYCGTVIGIVISGVSVCSAVIV